MESGFEKTFSGSTPKTASEAITLTVLGNRILANEGVLDGFGHVSIRNPENPNSFFIAAALPPAFVMPEDILEVDLDGKVLSQSGKRPYGERFIHSEIFRARPEVNAVCHNHAMPVVAMSVADVPIVPVFHMAGFFYDGVPYYDDYDVGNGSLCLNAAEGKRIAECLGKRRACVMRGHGAVVVGESIAHCTMASVYLSENCAMQSQALLLGNGKIHPFSTPLAQAAAQINSTDLPVAKGWSYWLSRARLAMPDIVDL